MTNQPHSEGNSLIEGEMISQASLMHALYREDNSSVYYHLDVCSMTYAASIKPFQ